MIIRNDKTYESNSNFPAENFYPEETGNLIIDETTQEGQRLAKLVKSHSPYFDLTVDTEGRVIDVIPLTPPAEFIRQQKQAEVDTQLAATDAGFIRVMEDLIDTLTAKGVLTLADLPTQAQSKLQTRKNLRVQRSSL